MSTSNNICNDGASKSSNDNDGICDMNNKLQNMSLNGNNIFHFAVVEY